MKIQEQINKAIERSDKAREASYNRWEKELKQVNGKFPSRDIDGRAHAPCDGYILDGVEYLGGQYLPEPEPMEEWAQQKRKIRSKLMASGELRDEILSLKVPHFTLSSGKSWENLGATTSYIYIEVPFWSALNARIIKIIQEAVDSEIKKQKQARADAIAKEKASAEDAPEGRQTVVGTVLKVFEYEGYGYYDPYTYKALFKLEGGATAFGTLAGAMSGEIGGKYEFTATFTPAEDDKKHAFFKRPSKVKEIQKES